MDSRSINKPLVIVGPTASGKTPAAIEIALRANGEIISADSRTVYEGLDIGTAKPSIKERKGIVHHLFDVVDPMSSYSAARFQNDAKRLIADIQRRGKLPIVVGGTGLYVDGLIFDYKFGAEPDATLREKLQSLSVDELRKYCADNNVNLPQNEFNKRYLIRSIEQDGINQQRNNDYSENFVIVGIATEASVLRERIILRAQNMFTELLELEALRAAERYGWASYGLQMDVYQLQRQLSEGAIVRAEALARLEVSDWHLVRKQKTWFKRNSNIRWYDANDLVAEVINSYSL